MADEQKNIEEIGDLPPEARDYFAKRAAENTPGPLSLEAILGGNKSVADSIRRQGVGTLRSQDGKDYMVAADLDEQGHVVAFAAAVPRSPGRSFDYIKTVDDFATDLVTSVQDRQSNAQLFHRIYSAEGLVNNAINKMAALVAPKGAFKVLSAKGTKGKSADKKALEAQSLLNWWKDNVNGKSDTGVITGDRGITSFVLQGARLAMIEGDHIARHFWPKQRQVVPSLGSNYTLPMNLQSFSVQNIFVPTGLELSNYELFYWQPPQALIQLIQSGNDPNVSKILKKVIGADVIKAVTDGGKYFLDPNLLLHVKHRATGISMFGQSLIEPALASIRYRRALDALELTVISNVIARLVIVMVGSDNDKSVYHKAEVSAKRLGLLQRMMRTAGPAATILWAGPDIEIKQVSAHDALPDIAERFKIAERRMLMDLGIPSVLLIGEGGDGKAVSFAAALSVAGMLAELQEQYAQALRTLGELILEENKFQEVSIVWEWQDNILDNKEAAATMILQFFTSGLFSSKTALEEMGFDYDAEVERQQEDVDAGIKEAIFGPPPGAQTTNPAGTGGETGGRPTNTGKPDPRSNKEAVTKPGNKSTSAPKS